MKKRLLIYLFLLFNISLIAQNEYGVLVETTLFPNQRPDGRSGRYLLIGFDKVIRYIPNNTSSTQTFYNFNYIDPATIPLAINFHPNAGGNVDDASDCQDTATEEYTINNLSFNSYFFNVCTSQAPTTLYKIHIDDDPNIPNEACINDVINLQYGWNWEYKFDDGHWTPFAAQYQNEREISFKLKDLAEYANKTKVYFRTGYGTNYTNILPYNIIGCSPELANPPTPSNTKCKGTASGSVTLAFKTPLKQGDQFLFNIWDAGGVFTSKFVKQGDMINNTYPWTGLAEGTYTMKYQAQSVNDYGDRVGLSAVTVNPFTIGSQSQLIFAAVETQPKCNSESGSILVTAQGGTSPYKYSRVLNGSTIESNVAFDSSVITSPLGAGSHTIYVSDANNCIIAPQTIAINPAPPAIEVSGTVTNKTASGPDNGQIKLDTPETGTPSYTFECIKGTDKFTDLQNLAVGTYIITTSNPLNCANDSKTFEVRQEISCNATKTDVKCLLGNDGTITLNIQGGSGNYAIEWKDSTKKTYNVSVPITSSNNGIYQYIATNLPPGEYTYTITDTGILPPTVISTPLKVYTNSETIIDPEKQFTVDEPIAAQPSPNSNNGSISIKAREGYGNYSYAWYKKENSGSPSLPFSPAQPDYATGLGNGEYTVIVTDKITANDTGIGCPIQKTIILKSLSITDISKNNINCFGESTGSIEVLAVGGTLNPEENIKTYQYQWYETNGTLPETLSELPGETNPKLSGRKAGKYKVEILDSYDPVLSHAYTLTQPNAPLTATVITTNESCFNSNDGTAIITATGGTPTNGNYSYSWLKNSVPLPTIPVATSNTLTAGNYEVIIKDQHQCITVTPTVFTITSPTDIIIPIPNIKKVSIFGQNLSDGAITIAPITGGLLENETSTDYDYSWTKDGDTTFKSTDLSPTGLGKGTYHLTVTAKNTNCSKTIECIVPENDKLTVAIQETASIFCFGTPTGKLHAEIIGGISPYKIAWYKKNEQTNTLEFISNLQDIDKLTAGEYSVKVMDSANPEPTGPFAEAEQLDYKLINQKTLLTVASTAQTDVLCHGAQTGAISLQIEGGTSPYSAVWSNENTTFPAKTNLGKLDTFSSIEAGIYSVTITDAHSCTAILSNPITIIQPTDPLLITDVEVKNLTGFETLNGRISVAINGGTAPYSYTWRSKGINTIIGDKAQISSLPIGTYELTITDDHNCTVTKEYTLVQPDKLLITSITQTPTSTIKCNGDKFGILVATITGGAPIGMLDADKNYTYKWYNVLTPSITASTTNPSETLVAGTYALTVTDVENNTFTLQSAPIIEPPLLKIDYTQANVSCYDGNNGTITITVTGGTGNHTIRWSNGKDTAAINNLREGIYTVTVTDDNQCQTIENITITEPGLLYVSKVTKNPPTSLGLKDGSIEIQVTGGTPNYNYLWYNDKKDLIYSDLNQPSNTSINNIFAGQYFITVTDAKGCAVIEKDLDKIDPLVLSVNQINIVKCNGDATASIKAAASGGTPIYYYKWYKTTDPLNAVGQAATLVNANAGTYYVVLSDSFGLTKQSENITITEPNNLNNTLVSEYTRCGDAKDWTITTTPTGGTAPYTYLWNTGDRSASLQDVAPANYSVLITDNHGCTITKNIVITAPIHLDTAETITKPTCFEGSDASIVLTSSGGQGPYTYLWNTAEKSNVLSNASAKVYSVAVTDFKGCVIDKTYTIENPPKDVINLGEDVTLCFDQSLTINSTIVDNNAKYNWTSTKGFTSNKPIITISEPAEYTLVVTNNLGCTATDMLKISKQETAISAEFAVSSQVFVNEKFIMVDISNPIADGIEWILPAEATVVSKNKDYAELSFSKLGEYELTLNTKKGNCTATQTKKIVVIEGEYIDPESTDLKKKYDVKIYPNPSNGIFTVDVTLDKVIPAHIKVYSLTNNVIIDSKYEEGKDAYQFNFSLSGLTAGVYFVLVESQQGNQLRKIIIN